MPVHPRRIHSRRTSRKPNLAPMPVITLNPGSMDNMNNEQQSSDTGPEPDTKADEKQPTPTGRPALPAFSFNPGAATDSDSSSSSPTHPILEEMAHNGSRRSSRPAAQPAFSFSPEFSETQITPSPTKSSFASDPPTSARFMGHRRSTSEFIGASEGTQVSSTPTFSVSPRKSALSPPVTGSGPPKFSHQHRRSQAVSISEIDTSELIKANAVAKHRPGSTPSTSIDLPSNDHFSRASQSISNLYERTPPTSPRRRASATGTRPRVGFSDTIDVIPRPLSMISSETEGSTSTVRGNHSLTGSITSLGSSAARSTPSPILDGSSSAQRPRTADAASLSSRMPMQVDQVDEIGLPKRPFSASESTSLFASLGSPVTKKRFWSLSGGSNETSPMTTPRHTPTVEETDPMTALKPFAPVVHTTSAQARPKTSPERKASIRKRKVRTIAGSIFSRKARSRGAQNRGRRTPTPPLSRSWSNGVADAVFDEDNTVVITNTPSPVQECPPRPSLTTVLPSQSSLSSYDDDDSDDRVTSPVIDLDAALGPFGSEARLPQTGFAAARNRMHSSVGRAMPDAFGVVHRRAESAPQMPPINRNTFGVHCLGSNPSVAEEVFDEEEEDDFLAEEKKPRAESDPTTGHDAGSISASESSDPDEATEDTTVAPSRPLSGLANSTNISYGVAIVDTEYDVTREAARSSNSTLTTPTMPESEIKQPTSSPMTLAYPVPQASYASSGEGRSAPGSAISSPDAEHINFDNYPRFGRHIGEPGPDAGFRFSTEDVPSLCDSVSTGNAPRSSSGAVTRSSVDQRPPSFSCPSTGVGNKPRQAWKRASLASLNKLIPGSSHGERSRLCVEESSGREQDDKARRKGNRISRLMNFWRSKEKENK
ncbi:hypothetical protein EPUS_05895 [Endocarpon pusillum Z07020]|uniref:Cell wall proline rich protein n=1 Tax=Endocarpon pusillum (strain Z07020 / HMAS-L-300199) TaxID=1263415 RepID=U1GNL1_ENDPU|nr:uncharacterized protein EPUS_05895 [Endocarpon pusillum Z07020]ERF73883.1 hypothetical protein EPUS_05895 [Endocarpon pusillum Z07020]